MNVITQKPATSDQIKQISWFGADTIEKVLKELGLSHAEVQRVIENGDEFAAAIRSAVEASILDLSTTDKYKDEEVESTDGYRSGYKPKSLTDQLARLKTLYPQLKDAEVADPGELPKGAEGWFTIPNIWKDGSLLSGDYSDLVERVLDLLGQDRDGKFHDFRNFLSPTYLCQSTRTQAAMRKMSEEQGHPDILVIAAQFGVQHRGRSVRRAREIMVDQGQYALGVFAIGVMLLLHPERLKHQYDLQIICAGDEFGVGFRASDEPSLGLSYHANIPLFHFDQSGQVCFEITWIHRHFAQTGSASGVLPQ